MLNRINTFIQDYKLFNNSDQLGLAISGGKDSVALAHILNQLNYKFVLVHCNFMLRGEESDEDEQFVLRLAESLENCNAVYTKTFETEKYARQNGLNTQLAARELRYNYFDELYNKKFFTRLLTAHHKNDLVETFFINLNRGAGLQGLKSIPPKRDFIVRPLLDVESKEIVNYLVENNINYREDSSNKSTNYLRNKLRNTILPKLKKELPNIIESTAQSVSILAQENELLNYFVEQAEKSICSENKDGAGVTISKSGLLSYPQSGVILYRIIDKYGFNFSQTEQIVRLGDDSSGQLFYSKSHQLLVDREHYIIKGIEETKPFEIEVREPGIYRFNNATINIQPTDKLAFNTSTNHETVCLNSTHFPLTLRYWKDGDYIIPLGMTGKKLLSDFFIDAKMTVFEKHNTPLICNGNNVLWICGKRISNQIKASENSNLYSLNVIFET